MVATLGPQSKFFNFQAFKIFLNRSKYHYLIRLDVFNKNILSQKFYLRSKILIVSQSLKLDTGSEVLELIFTHYVYSNPIFLQNLVFFYMMSQKRQ